MTVRKFVWHMRRLRAGSGGRLFAILMLYAALTLSASAYAGMPELSERLLAEGRGLAQAGNLDSARQMLERAIVAEPANALALAWLGVTHDGLGNGETAQKYYQLAMDVDPDHPRVLLLAGLGDIGAREIDQARGKLARLHVICGEDCSEAQELGAALETLNE